jgi:hypothetical protein
MIDELDQVGSKPLLISRLVEEDGKREVVAAVPNHGADA